MREYRHPVRVYYEDTDAGGVVYHANYLRFMERSRTDWLRELGFEQDALMQDPGIVFAVRRVEIDYLKPARFNDALTVVARVAEHRRTTIMFEQEILRDSDDTILSRGRILVVCINAKNFRPAALPTAILEHVVDVE